MFDPRSEITPPASFPYSTHLDVYYGPLEVVDVPALVDAVTQPWHMVEGADITPTGDWR